MNFIDFNFCLRLAVVFALLSIQKKYDEKRVNNNEKSIKIVLFIFYFFQRHDPFQYLNLFKNIIINFIIVLYFVAIFFVENNMKK
jgi:hypothetical protein